MAKISKKSKNKVTLKSKKRSAFYNCYVLILRLKIEDKFKEFHVKIFNTGKLEIPGIQNETAFLKVLTYVSELISNITSKKISVKKDYDTVLINSNFSCGYYINREVLCEILKYKYK